ncbi:cyanophycin synthetase [Gordonia sp. PvP123]|uniref:glutamate ligase domain-containing protein n=1 Tax=Gordonia sp. PvP123 TaxID=3156470 RepID=UPI0033965C5B
MGLQVLGPHQVGNALLALTAAVADGVDLAAAAEGISAVTGISGRCEPVHAGQPYRAIVDYMHNTAGQHALFPYLRSLTEGGRLIVVVGATGGRDPGKREPLGEVAAQYADVVIVTDESPEDEDPNAIRARVLRVHAARRRRSSSRNPTGRPPSRSPRPWPVTTMSSWSPAGVVTPSGGTDRRRRSSTITPSCGARSSRRRSGRRGRRQFFPDSTASRAAAAAASSR